MLEIIEKAVMTGLGAVALSQKKAEELLAELKEKYKLSEEEGKAFMERLQGFAKESREKIAEAAETEVKKVMERVGVVSRDDYDLLLKRVEELERRLSGNP